VGTTSVCPYIAAPVHRANRDGKLTVEINPGTSEVSHVVHHRIRAGAAETMGRLAQLLET
jgi:NAD-dependent deacetylase